MRQKRTVAHSVVELQTAFIGETRRPRIQVSGFHGADNRSYIKDKTRRSGFGLTLRIQGAVDLAYI